MSAASDRRKWLVLFLFAAAFFAAVLFRPAPVYGLDMRSMIKSARTVPEGYYAIRPAKNTSYAIGVSNDENQSVVLRTAVPNGTASYQVWRFIYLGSGLYSIENYGSGKYLNVSDWGYGNDVVQYRNGRPADNEKWYVIPYGSNWYLVPYCQQTQALDIDNGVMGVGTNIHLWDQIGGDTQLFSFARFYKDSPAVTIPESRTLANGNYYIRPALNTNYAVGAVNSSSDEVSLRSFVAGAQNQIWHFSYLENGLYCIENKGTGKYLDVSDWGQGDDVVQYKDGFAAPNEKWYVCEDNGAWYLVPYIKMSKALDIDNGIMSHGTNVHLWDQTKGDTQRLILTPETEAAPLALPTYDTYPDGFYDGYYYIQPKADDDYALGTTGTDVESVSLRTWNPDAQNQLWHFMHLGGGLYCIENCGSRKYLNVSEYGAGSDVIQYRDARPADNEKWYIVKDNYHGCVYLVPYCQSSKALDVAGGVLASGSNVQIWSQNRSYAQQFRLERCTKVISQLMLPKFSMPTDGTYVIRPYGEKNYAVGAESASSDRVTLRSFNAEADNQAWIFSHVRNGLYTIENKGTGKFLDVSDYGAGDDVVQYRNGDAFLNELWYVVPVGKVYYLVPYCQQSKALDIDNGVFAHGTNVHLWEQTQGDTQKLELVSLDLIESGLSGETVGSGSGWDVGGLVDLTPVIGIKETIEFNGTEYYIYNAVAGSNSITLTLVDINDPSKSDTQTVPGTAEDVVSVTYDGNGGTAVPEPQGKLKETSLRLRTDVPVRANFTFEGWATQKNGKADYQPGDLYDEDEPLTLYAVWKAVPATERIVYEVEVVEAVGQTLYLKGWAYDTTDPSATLSITVYSGKEAIACDESSYYVREDINEEYGITGAHGFEYTYATGLTGLYDVALYIDYADRSGRKIQPVATVNYHREYTITFDANGGTAAPRSLKKIEFERTYFPAGIPVRERYTFAGWCEQRDAAGQTLWHPGDPWTQNRDVTFYAAWTKIDPDLALPASLTEIGEEAFAGGSFAYVVLPEVCESIGSGAFRNCGNLRWIEIPDSVRDIAEDAFEGCGDVTLIGPGSYLQSYAEAHGLAWMAE